MSTVARDVSPYFTQYRNFDPGSLYHSDWLGNYHCDVSKLSGTWNCTTERGVGCRYEIGPDLSQSRLVGSLSRNRYYHHDYFGQSLWRWTSRRIGSPQQAEVVNEQRHRAGTDRGRVCRLYPSAYLSPDRLASSRAKCGIGWMLRPGQAPERCARTGSWIDGVSEPGGVAGSARR